MSYPVIQTPPVPAADSGDCQNCIVSLPVQSTTSLRFSTVVTQGENLVLKNVGTINATYVSDNVAQQSVTITPGNFYSMSQPLMALCVKVSSTALVNLLVSGGTAVALNVNTMLFVDEALEGFEISAPTGTDAPDVRVELYYALAAQ